MSVHGTRTKWNNNSYSMTGTRYYSKFHPHSPSWYPFIGFMFSSFCVFRFCSWFKSPTFIKHQIPTHTLFLETPRSRIWINRIETFSVINGRPNRRYMFVLHSLYIRTAKWIHLFYFYFFVFLGLCEIAVLCWKCEKVHLCFSMRWFVERTDSSDSRRSGGWWRCGHNGIGWEWYPNGGGAGVSVSSKSSEGIAESRRRHC